jgi:glycine cleavage system H protein
MAGDLPSDRSYSKEHEWALPQPDGLLLVGITDHAAHELGDVVYVALPAVGTSLKQFAKFGEIESVKAVSDLFSPVSGEVVAVNEALNDHPELVNQSPFADGWIVRVRPAGSSEMASLLDAAGYAAFLAEIAG